VLGHWGIPFVSNTSAAPQVFCDSPRRAIFFTIKMLVPALRRQALQQAKYARVALPSLTRWYASFPPHTVVKMPALSPTMTAGGIGAWGKKPGDSISPGEVLVEIETDKAQMDFEFQEEGVLAKILKETGEKDVPVGNVRILPPTLIDCS